MSDDYIKPKDLKVYQLSRKVSKIGWKAYNKLDWRDKKIMEISLSGQLIL